MSDNKLSNVLDTSPNILDPEKCTENATVGWNSEFNGYDIMKTVAESNYCISHVFNVKTGQKFIFTHKGYQANIYLAKSNGKIFSQLTIEDGVSFSIPEEITFMRYRFTTNSSDMNNGQWKKKVMLCEGETLPNKFAPYGSMVMKDNIEIPLYSKKSESVLYTKIDKRSGRIVADRMIIIPSFDGMNVHTFNTVMPYMKEKGLPFTIFSGGVTDKELIKKFQTVTEYGGEMQFYNGQPAATYEGQDNYIEQYEQFNEHYENFLKMCVGKPKFVAYSGGRYTTITEKIAKQFGIKWARTTEADWVTPKNWDDSLFNTPAFFMNNSNYTTMININDWDIKNKMIRPFLNHNILSDTITDESFNISWEKLKSVLDKIYELKESGKAYVMNYSQAFDYLRFPRDVEVGHHVLLFESDGQQHEYVKYINGWKELTI